MAGSMWDLPSCMATTFEGVIEAGKLWTGEPTRDAHLRSADFFDVENHPEITFAGRFVERVGDIDFKAVAELTIRGETDRSDLTSPIWASGRRRTGRARSISAR